MRLSNRKPSYARLAAAVAVMATSAVLAVPGVAAADTGDRTKTVACGPFQSVAYSGGPAHANIRNCSITWGKNIFDGSYWQTVSFQLLDSYTDGHCARAIVQDSTTGVSTPYSECNGVWTTKTKTYGTRNSWINILVNYGSSSSWYGISGGDLYTAPTGF